MFNHTVFSKICMYYMNNETINSLQKALASKLIACVAGLWTPDNKYCLPINIAAGVLRASGTRVLVLHVPIPKNIDALNDEVLSFEKLTQELNFPLSEMVFFFNTSMYSTLEDVQQILKMMDSIRSVSSYNSNTVFLKLELLDENLQPNDELTCRVLEQLPEKDRSICLPFLIGNEESLQYVTNLGCPAARIWSSKIGGRAGITDEARLRRIIDSASIPLILEGGLGTPEHVQQALQIGFSAVLLNSAFRFSEDPIKLATEIRNIIDNSKL